MKIGRNNSALVITITEQEHAFLLHAEFVKVSFEVENRVSWVRLEKTTDSNGSSRLLSVTNDLAHVRRIDITSHEVAVGLSTFGTEHVQAKSPMGGILYGAKPTMLKPLTPMMKGKNKLSNPANMPGLEHLKEAVLIINNFRKRYGEQMEVTFTDGELKVRMMLEI